VRLTTSAIIAAVARFELPDTPAVAVSLMTNSSVGSICVAAVNPLILRSGIEVSYSRKTQ
jgi:hypothetical protein